MVNCKFCRKQIEENQLLLHELYCENNCIKCNRCGYLYDRNEEEAHEEEFHKILYCQFCKNTFQDVNKHVCKQSTILCKYCQIDVHQNNFQEHVDQCGSRTELCNYCKQYIQKRDLNSHQLNCPQENVNNIQSLDEYKQKIIEIKEQRKQQMNYPQQIPSLIQNQELIQQFQDPNYFQENQQNLVVKPTQNNQEFNYNIDMKYNQEDVYYNTNNLPQNQNLEQIQVQKYIQESIQKPIFQFNAQNPIASQNQSQDQYLNDSNVHFKLSQNPQFQQQFQQNQNNFQYSNNLYTFQYKIENQVRTSQLSQNQYGIDFQQNIAQDQQSNPIQGSNPKKDIFNQQFQYGIPPSQKYQSQSNQDNQMDIEFQQQVKQDYQKVGVEDNKVQNNNTQEINNNYNDSIIGKILQEYIQADILQMSYKQYKEQQKLQQKLESQKQQVEQPKMQNQNVQTIMNTEFDFGMTYEDKQIQIVIYEQLQKQRNQKR